MLIDSNVVSSGIYHWIVNGTVSNQCLIKIVDSNNDECFDISDDIFKIINATGINMDGNGYPKSFILFQNLPNPFNPSTTIKFGIPKYSRVKIEIFNSNGQKVETLVNKDLNPGYYKVTWYGASYSSGFYFVRMKSDNYIKIIKILLLK